VILMPKQWELRITRVGEQVRNGKRRTVGRYEVFHDGKLVPELAGATAETRGPGANAPRGNNRCIEVGTYDLHIQSGKKYSTMKYTNNVNPVALKRPGLLVLPTGKRVGILIHPARGFLWSIGCINPAKALSGGKTDLDFVDSRTRVIALIDDLRKFLGNSFPSSGGARIPGARIIIQER
jgi:hypothetical protein